MGVLATLVPQAQPALRRCRAAGTDGATWRWPLTVRDSNGNPIDLTGCTAICRIVNTNDEIICEPSVTLGNGTLVIEVPETQTSGLTAPLPAQCRWSLTVSDGDDVVQFWGVDGSPFKILKSA